MRGNKAKLPLPPGYFICPPLTPKQKDTLQQEAVACAMNLAYLAEEKKDIEGWIPLWDQSDLIIHRGPDYRAVNMTVAKTEVAGSIEEAAALFEHGNTLQAKEYVKRFGRDLEDAAALYTIAEPTSEWPRNKIGVNWMALRSPWRGIVQNRDCCLLECQHEFTKNGKRGWVRALRSVEIDCCPDLPGLVRMHNGGTGHVFIESSRPGYLDAYYIVQADFKLNAGDWALEHIMVRRSRSLLDIDQFLCENRLSQTPFASFKTIQAKSAQHHCHLCARHFGWLRAKASCAKCGFIFCRRCISLWRVKTFGAKHEVWACATCCRNISAFSSRIDGNSMGSSSNSSSGSAGLRSSEHNGVRLTGKSTETLSISSYCRSVDENDDMSNYSESVVTAMQRNFRGIFLRADTISTPKPIIIDEMSPRAPQLGHMNPMPFVRHLHRAEYN